MSWDKIIAGARDLSIIILLFCVVVAASFSFLSKEEKGPVMIISNLHFEQSVIEYGRDLTIISNINLLRTCNVTVHRIITDVATNKVVVREDKPSASNELGKYESRVLIDLPPDLTPGEYKYRAVLYSDCQGANAPTIFTPSLPFTIIPNIAK